jgi:hypothetical protein
VPTVVLVGLGVIVGAYILQVSAAALGFLRVQRQPRPPAPDVWPSVSIVVPARNEADGIAQCLDSLRACNYPEDRYEIIIVDDGSRDGTAARVQARPPVAAGAAREAYDHSFERAVCAVGVAGSAEAGFDTAIVNDG